MESKKISTPLVKSNFENQIIKKKISIISLLIQYLFNIKKNDSTQIKIEIYILLGF